MEGDLARLRVEEAAVLLRGYFNSCDDGLKQAFESCDKNGDKSLDAAELVDLLGKLGYAMELPEAVQLVRMYDCNGDDQLQYFEVVRMLSHDGLPVDVPHTSSSYGADSSYGSSYGDSPEMTSDHRFDAYVTPVYQPAPQGTRYDVAMSHSDLALPSRFKLSEASNPISPHNSPKSNAQGILPLTTRSRTLLREINDVVYQHMHTLLKAFREFDCDGDKHVTVNEFVRILEKHDVLISHEEAWNLFSLVAPGSLELGLTYGDFVRLLAAGNTKT